MVSVKDSVDSQLMSKVTCETLYNVHFRVRDQLYTQVLAPVRAGKQVLWALREKLHD